MTERAIKVVDVLQCAKPLIFENTEAEYRYSIQGTCFLVGFQSRYYAITAKHCLRDRAWAAVRVRLIPGRLEFLRVMGLMVFEREDQDYLDLAFLEINMEGVPEAEKHNPNVLELDSYKEPTLNGTDVLATIGYPTERNTIDYERTEINTQGFTADGHYDGPAEDKHCSQIQFNRLDPIEDLNGLSGSPVFSFRSAETGVYRHSFAGVLVRATRESGRGRFVNSAVVVEMLKQLSARCKR